MEGRPPDLDGSVDGTIPHLSEDLVSVTFFVCEP